jgi:hypothetical protein
VIEAWRAAGGVARECDFTLAQVYSADEAFVTGTLGGVTPVTKVDGRVIGDGQAGQADGPGRRPLPAARHRFDPGLTRPSRREGPARALRPMP